MKTTPFVSASLSILFILALSPQARAQNTGGLEDRYLNSLKGNGYKCTNTPKSDGYFCVKSVAGYQTYVTIPKGMSSHSHNVFYAHGLVGVCGNGASGEQYLKNYAPTLRRIGAIGIMPFRRDAASANYPLASGLAQVEKDLAGDHSPEHPPLIMAGHSAAGGFLGRELLSNSQVLSRVDQAFLIDAIYSASSWGQIWANVVNRKPNLKIRLVSSTTASASRTFVGIVKQHDPNISLETKSDGHCNMPKYFSELQ